MTHHRVNKAQVAMVMSEAHACASVMLESANYIVEELPNVYMSDKLRAQTKNICDSLVGTKFDIIHELYEIDDLLEDNTEDSAVVSRLVRVVQWLKEDITPLLELVTALESARQKDPRYISSNILVTESVTNILNAFNRTREEADGLTPNTDTTSNAS